MTTIHEQFLEIAAGLERRGTPARRVVFSDHGYRKMLNERRSWEVASDPFNPPRTYMGLPYSVLPGMAGEIGLHPDYEPTRGAVTIKLGFDATSGRVLVDGKPHGEPVSMMQIVGKSLSAAQVCDICMAWLESDDPTHWGTFEKELFAVIEKHGRFE